MGPSRPSAPELGTPRRLERGRCAACDDPVASAVVFCGPCAATAQRTILSPSRGCAGGAQPAAAFVYGGAIARAIVRMKYERRPDLARPLADLLWSWIEPHRAALSHVVVVPVPLHFARFAERGFNQSALVACFVARRLQVPLAAAALARTRDTPRQATLDRRARAENVAGAFAVRQSDRIAKRSILLVDDVVATGATLHGCARTLLRGGAAHVLSVAVAQAELS